MHSKIYEKMIRFEVNKVCTKQKGKQGKQGKHVIVDK